MIGRKLNTEEFIEKANKIHNFKYDYSQTKFINATTKVKIICKGHGEFEQLAGSHIYAKSGCQKCCIKKISKKLSLNTEEFIEKANKIHNFKYDYSLVEYINNMTKVKIICKEHGIFEQIPKSHLDKNGCKKCGITKRASSNLLTQEEFIEKSNKIHNNKYNYSQVEYINNKTKIKIICPVHGIFEQLAGGHLNKKGCKKCGIINIINKSRSNTRDFINKAQKIHKNKYDYSQTKYIDSREKVKIICKKHGVFEQIPSGHLQKYGCSQCPTVISKPHQKVIDYLKDELSLKENIDFIINDRSLIKPFELDLYFPNYKLAIEIDGIYWHGKLDRCKQDKQKLTDREERKNKLCESKKVKLLRFTDLEIDNDFEKVIYYLTKIF